MANLRTNNLSGEQGQNAYRGSVFFDGESQLDVTSNSDFAVGTGAYTAELWFHSGLNSGENSLFGTFTASNFGFGMWHNANNLYFEERQNAFSGDNPRIIYDTFEEGHWYHIAMCRDSSSGTLRAYVNGVQIGSTTSNLRTIAGTAPTIGENNAAANQCKGYISNIRFSNTELYPSGTTFTPPTSELTADASTILLACQNSDDPTQEETGKTLTNSSLLSDQPKVIPPYGVDAGNAFGGSIQQSSQGYMYFPTGRAEERGRGRGVYGGGGISTPTNPANIAYIDVQSQGNTTRFGDLTTSNRVWIHGFGSSTRAIWSGGGNTGGSNTANTIDFVTIATTSNATDFGDATVAALARASLSNDTRGLSACGYVAPANINTIDFVTVATLGNATDFGDATVARRGVARMGSSTRGIFAGGMTPSASDVMDFVTIASTGNAQDFGNLVVAARHDSQGCSNGTRGIIAGGNTPSGDVNTIQFVTIASAGDASDFGDLQQTMEACGSLDNTIRGVFSGSYTPSLNTMNFITIATTGNALDFGDNTDSNYAAGGTSDSHGGLS